MSAAGDTGSIGVPEASATGPGQAPPTSRLLALGVLLVFAVLAAVTASRHEMWRDEIHAWQAVAESGSLLEADRAVRNEGHPVLWFALLYPASRATTNPAAMQVVHATIAISVAALILFAAPFPFRWRVLIVFGYFPMYEYSIICRNYAVGALLLFSVCAVYPFRSRRPLVLAGLLFLLAQASAYALVMSFALGLMFIADGWMSRHRTPIPARRAGIALAVWLAGIVVSVAQLARARVIMQPLDPDKMLETSRTLNVLATPWRGYVPLPHLRFHYWNSNILDGIAFGDVIQVALGLALVSVFVSVFVRRLPVLLLYVVGSAGFLAFSYFVYVGHLRHHGHHLLLLLACLWLLHRGPGGDIESSAPAKGRPWAALVMALLVANSAAGLYATVRDWLDPFSAGRDVARFIRSRELDGLPVVGHRDVQVATVSGYLERPVYYPSLGREATFVPWGGKVRPVIGDSEAVQQAREMAKQRHSDVLIVFSRLNRRRPDSLHGAMRIRDFSRSIVRSERYELFRVSPPGD